jgi:hypothetical protein
MQPAQNTAHRPGMIILYEFREQAEIPKLVGAEDFSKKTALILESVGYQDLDVSTEMTRFDFDLHVPSPHEGLIEILCCAERRRALEHDRGNPIVTCARRDEMA